MLKMSYAGCPGPFSAISAKFTIKMCVADEDRQKFTKTPYSVSYTHLTLPTNREV